MYQLWFYVPLSHLEQVKSAVFNTGAGRLGGYSECCFETSGVGQFKPNEASQPFVGEHGLLEKVDEVKVELVVSASEVEATILALRKAHPYEEPALGAIKLDYY